MTRGAHPLKSARTARGFTQMALADLSGFSFRTIRAIECWKGYPDGFTRECLLDTLGIPREHMDEVFPIVGRSTTDLDVPLRRVRRSLSMSQHALAHRAGISRWAVIDIEAGRTTRPQGSTQRALLGALGLGLERAAEIFPEAHR